LTLFVNPKIIFIIASILSLLL